MPIEWPTLPDALLPNHAYGVLKIQYDEDDEPREEILASLNLGTGEVKPESYLSRTAYDWVCDIITFQVYESDVEMSLDEGEREDFVVDEDDLPKARETWSQTQAKRLGESLPGPTAAAGRAPRL